MVDLALLLINCLGRREWTQLVERGIVLQFSTAGSLVAATLVIPAGTVMRSEI